MIHAIPDPLLSLAEPPSVLRRRTLPMAHERISLGRRGLAIGPLCLGAIDDPDVVVRAFDAGVNAFFVTVDMHWPGYEGMRRGLRQLLGRRKVRDEIVVFATSYVSRPEWSQQPYRELLHEVPELGRLDVLVAGGAYAEDALPRCERLGRHVAAGFAGAGAVGMSFHDRMAARVAIAGELLDVAFVRYCSAHPRALGDVLPFMPVDGRTRVLTFKSMAGYVSPARARAAGIDEETWLPAPTDHYRFALSRAGVAGVLCSPRSTAELDALVQALAKGPLREEEEEHLIALSERVRPPAAPARRSAQVVST